MGNLVPLYIVTNLFIIEDIDQKAISTAPEECKPHMWKIYVNYVLERGQYTILSSHGPSKPSTSYRDYQVHPIDNRTVVHP